MPRSSRTVELDLPLGDLAPDGLRPMLPMVAAEPFDSPLHQFEVAWDGVRAVAVRKPGGVRVWGRGLRDLTLRYPELQALDRILPFDTVVDGELIVGDSHGRPDPLALAERVQADNPSSVEAAALRHPITYVVYDLLVRSGRSLVREPLHRRRTLLKETLSGSGRIYLPEPILQEGIALYDAARDRGLEGIVAKRLDGRYHPGRRHPDWLLVLAVRREDFVVMGFTPGRGQHLVESLVVGSVEGAGFRPVGRVGGGFDAGAGFRLRRLLDGLPAVQPPDEGRWNAEGTVWVEPSVVVSVKFSEWDARGHLRFPIFSGLRPEIAPEECIRTQVIEAPSPSRAGIEIQVPTLPI